MDSRSLTLHEAGKSSSAAQMVDLAKLSLTVKEIWPVKIKMV